jgi:hypothetical protein
MERTGVAELADREQGSYTGTGLQDRHAGLTTWLLEQRVPTAG